MWIAKLQPGACDCVNLLFWRAIKPPSASERLAHQQHGHMCLTIQPETPDSGPQRLHAVKAMFVFLALFNSFLRGLLPSRSSLMPVPLPLPIHSSWQALRLHRWRREGGEINKVCALINGFNLNFIHVVFLVHANLLRFFFLF